MISFVVTIHIDNDNLKQAYRELCVRMGSTGLDWESMDEWYDHVGDLGSEEELQAATCSLITAPLLLGCGKQTPAANATTALL